MMSQFSRTKTTGSAPEPRQSRKTPARRGQALVPVVFILMILTVVAVAFAAAASHEIRSAGNFAAETKRYYAARGAVYYAVSSLAQTSNNGATYGVITPAPDTDSNGWQQVGDAWVKVEAVDTAGLLNINKVDSTTLQTWPLFQQNPDLAAAIIDWRSPGDQPSPNGAKSSYYQSLPQPYNAKEAPFDTLEELLLVKGMTPALLYGSLSGNAISAADIAAITSNGNSTGIGSGLTRQSAGGLSSGGGTQGGTNTGGSGSGTQSGGNSTGTGSPDPNQFADLFASSRIPVAELLTTLVSERNVAVDGTARVNINTATEQDLVDKLQLPENLATNLVNFRNAGNTNGGGTGQGGGAQGGGTQGGGTQNGGGSNGGNGIGLGGGPGLSGGGGSLGQPGGAGPGNAGPGNAGPGGLRSHHASGRRSRQAPGLGGNQGLGLGSNQGLGLGNQGLGLGNQGNSGGGNSGGSNTGGNNGGSSNTGGNGNGAGSGQTSSVFKSIADLLEVSGFTRTIMSQIADKIAVDDNAARDDVVNINTAPQEVLAMVPGMDSTILNAIMTYRQSGQAFQSLNDFFALQQLQRPQFQQVIAHLSTKSSIYRLHVRVRTAGQQNLYAAIVLVELTPNGPRILQWREAPRTPGWSTWIPAPTLPAPTAPTTQNGSL